MTGENQRVSKHTSIFFFQSQCFHNHYSIQVINVETRTCSHYFFLPTPEPLARPPFGLALPWPLAAAADDEEAAALSGWMKPVLAVNEEITSLSC